MRMRSLFKRKLNKPNIFSAHNSRCKCFFVILRHCEHRTVQLVSAHEQLPSQHTISMVSSSSDRLNLSVKVTNSWPAMSANLLHLVIHFLTGTTYLSLLKKIFRELSITLWYCYEIKELWNYFLSKYEAFQKLYEQLRLRKVKWNATWYTWDVAMQTNWARHLYRGIAFLWKIVNW